MKKQNLVILLVCIVVLAGGVTALVLNLRSADSKESSSTTAVESSAADSIADSSKAESEAVSSEKDGITVTVSIDCSDIQAHYDDLESNLRDEKYVPSDGMILPQTEYTVKEGETVLELLKEISSEKNIPIDVVDASQSAYGSAYVKGINNISEKSCGEQSGWTFYVNDAFAENGCDQQVLNAGDKIDWKFVCSWE